ncbi:glycosyltransferase family 4 protein [Phreatobacter aquaticus]|uniref:Glycosyltransferase family 4 protein n=1 Tax=Phreatobacter aquaticus TaxID=2570229 RepID=A0A4D7QUJ1_9HYPH|nr:glycosyltransferase family 4 protein [Phreatobacter aquaticus]QCK87612.1 glycosyltransferase family 4 protein [Phreatobacter aquaticus]
MAAKGVHRRGGQQGVRLMNSVGSRDGQGADGAVAPLRIAIVTQYFWPEVFPINAMAEALAARGHLVDVLTGLPNYPGGTLHPGYGIKGPWSQRHGTIAVKRLPLISRGTGSRLRLAANYVSFAIASFFIAPIRMRGRYDVILANQASPLLGIAGALSLAFTRRHPLVLWIQDLWPESLVIAGVRSGVVRRAMDSMMRYSYHRSAAVMIQSRGFQDHPERYGVATEAIHYVPNWADPVFRPINRDDAMAENAEMPAGFRIVVAGNLGEAQAVHTLVEAARLLKGHPTIRIVVIGDGRMRAWLESEIERLELAPTLIYLGHRSFHSMPAYYAAADALLLMLRREPTMARTIPSRLQAYLACGRPVIAALDGEAQRVVVDAGAGIGVAAEVPEDLAAAIRMMAAATSDELARMAQRAEQCSREEFNSALIVDRVEAVLRDVARASAKGTP